MNPPITKEYVLDANAVMRYFQNQPGADAVEKLIQRELLNEIRLYMSVVNLGEVFYSLAKFIGEERTLQNIRELRGAVEAVPLDEEFAIEAAALKYHYKMGYSDSIAAVLAMRRKATLVTADPDFEKLGKRLKVMALTRHNE